MKRKNNYLSIVLQFLIASFFIILIFYSIIYSFQYSLNIPSLLFIYLPVLIQEVTYTAMAYQLFQIPEINKGVETKLLHLILLFLSIDGLIIIPTFYASTGIFLLSSLIIGKIHLFSILSIALLFLFCGLIKNDIGTKKYKNNTVFFITIALLLVYFQNIQAPTTMNNNLPLVPSTSFTILVISISLLAISAYLPSYWKDKSHHNMFRTISYAIIIISSTVLRYTLTIPFIFTLVAIPLLIFGIVLFLVNLKSYSI